MTGAALASKVIGTGLAGLVLWQSADIAMSTIAGFPHVDLARRIEEGAIVDLKYLDAFDRRHPDDRLVSLCDVRFRRARLTIELARLDLAVAEGDFTNLDLARERAMKAARRVIECAPLDGNAWLRYAMVETAAGGLTPAVREKFATADRLAPYEGWVIRARLPFYADLASRGIEGFAEPALRDFRSIVLYTRDVGLVIRLVKLWPGQFLEPYRGLVTLLPVRERRRHESAATEAELDIGQPRKREEVVPFLDAPSGQPTAGAK